MVDSTGEELGRIKNLKMEDMGRMLYGFDKMKSR
jgi:hypothetical protein